MSETWVSAYCKGELCSMCGEPATAKVGEEILSDDPIRMRHNLIAFVCPTHFRQIFGRNGTALVSASREAKIKAAAGY